ncbi:hypothetical protein ANN_04876 [Periplaneta americana]|uniref:Uncharacterized protein n=1 Tax=Periplaneta americana TaxID=6978 RepID=A0ABQ8TB69_PERAM|nr:hypothetical protein ANN_04876 [Periplaneta americana]
MKIDISFSLNREPVKFDVHLRGAPNEVVQLVQNIKDVAEQFLYHWKTFPIILPPPLTVSSAPLHQHQHQHQNSTGGNSSELNAVGSTDSNGSSLSLARRSNKHLNMRDLFLAPSFDELDAVAVDAKGEPRRLNNKQLESIRERGLIYNVEILRQWLEEGCQQIWQMPGMWKRVRQLIMLRSEAFIRAHGGHFEHFL